MKPGQEIRDTLWTLGFTIARLMGSISCGQLGRFHITCLFFYFGDLRKEDSSELETQIETDDMPKNNLQCLHTLIVTELLNIEYIHISNSRE